MTFSIENAVLQLSLPLKRKRKALGLTLHEVGEIVGVGGSTLSRIERCEGKPDAETIARLANWLEMPLDRIYHEDLSTIFSIDEDLPTIVARHLDKDENLTPQSREFLTTFFRQTYRQFLKVERSRKTGGQNASA